MCKAAAATGQPQPALFTVSRDGALFYWMLDKPAEDAAAPAQPSSSTPASGGLATRKRTLDGEQEDAVVAIAGASRPGKRHKGRLSAADASDVHDALSRQSRTYAGVPAHLSGPRWHAVSMNCLYSQEDAIVAGNLQWQIVVRHAFLVAACMPLRHSAAPSASSPAEICMMCCFHTTIALLVHFSVGLMVPSSFEMM